MAKNRGLVNRKPLSNAVDVDLFDKLERLHQETRIPKSKLIDEALSLLWKHYHPEEGQQKE